MSKIITLRKGLDINLRGKAQESLADAPQASEYALSPLDFEGVTPKLLVKVGDEVKAGTPLFFNKYSERVLFTSPVSGTVAAVNRGEKRKVLSVTVTPDATQSYEEFAKPDLQKASREEIVELLLRSGLWPMIVQRPYGLDDGLFEVVLVRQPQNPLQLQAVIKALLTMSPDEGDRKSTRLNSSHT